MELNELGLEYGEIKSNVACPYCSKIIGAETLKELVCEHCGKSLKVKTPTK